MSLLDNINKSKCNLKHSVTTVTQADGSSYIESKQGGKQYLKPCLGFVVDTKPDKIPAKILDNLYVGSQDCVDKNVFQQYDIKYILCIGIPFPDTNLLASYPITCKYIPCLDLPETNLINTCKESNIFIKDSLSKGSGSILVHCNAGVSRSVSIIIGYLILEKDFGFDDAYKLVKTNRPSAQPNPGFLKQLRNFKRA